MKLSFYVDVKIINFIIYNNALIIIKRIYINEISY